MHLKIKDTNKRQVKRGESLNETFIQTFYSQTGLPGCGGTIRAVTPHLLMLEPRGEVSRCSALAAEAMLSACRAGMGSGMETRPRCSGRVWEAISGMSWDMAVEAEEMTSGERARVGEAWWGRRWASRTWAPSRESGPLTPARICREAGWEACSGEFIHVWDWFSR